MALGDRVVNFVVKISGDTKDLSRDLGKVEGDAKQATGRIKTAVGRVGTFVSENMTAGLAAAGTAVAAFAVKSVGEFQKLALQAQSTSTAIGTTVEDASRWIEVSGDLGVEVGTLEGAFNRMNREAEKGSLKALGIDAQSATDRFIGVLTYLRQIPDETKRAAEAQRLLGRSWQDLAPLLDSVGQLRERLAGVSDAKVIDPEEVQKAKDLRDAMDNLKDSADDVTLAVGEGLVGALNDLNAVLDPITGDGGLGKITEALVRAGTTFTALNLGSKLVGLFSDSGDAAEKSGAQVAILSEDMEVFKGKARDSQERTRRLWEEQRALNEQYRAAQEMYRQVGLAIAEHERKLDGLIAKARELRDAAMQANAAQSALTNVGTAFGVQDSLNAFEAARQNWMTQNHEATFAGELGLDPAAESAQAQDALVAARDAALNAVRASMAMGKTPSQQAALGAGTLSTILSQNPWLAEAFPQLPGLLGTLSQQAGGGAGGGAVPGAFTGPGGIKGALGGATIIVTGGADPYLSMTAATQYATRNGTQSPV